MAGRNDRGVGALIRRGWRNVREAGRRRLAGTALLILAALLIARFAWFVPVIGDAERALYDVRALLLSEQAGIAAIDGKRRDR